MLGVNHYSVLHSIGRGLGTVDPLGSGQEEEIKPRTTWVLHPAQLLGQVQGSPLAAHPGDSIGRGVWGFC